MTDDSQLNPWIFMSVCAIAIIFCAGWASYSPTPEQKYQERVKDHWNLPKWARGDYPQRTEPRRHPTTFGLEW